MRRIRLKFLGLGYDRTNQAYVRVYNMKGCLVYRGWTHNNQLYLCLNNGCYKLIATSCTGIIKQCFMVTNNINTYYFTFTNALYNPNGNARNLTFLLTDYNYNNLPIGKGILNFG